MYVSFTIRIFSHNKKQMEKFEFKDKEEFIEFLSDKTPKMTVLIFNAINQAIKSKKKSADLFEVSFETGDTCFEISLPKSQWETALTSCLKHFEDFEMSDDAIDAYLLLKELKA